MSVWQMETSDDRELPGCLLGISPRGRNPCGAKNLKGLHRRKMSAHALLKMTRDRFRVMSLAPRRKCPRNVVQMKKAMAAFFGSDSVAISCHCKRSKIILVKVLT